MNPWKNLLNDEFLINKIKKNNKDEKEKINDLYETKNKESLIKINNSIDLNQTDIIFSVSTNYFGYNNYNSLECLFLIQNKLRNKHFLTLICSKIDIFISWTNIYWFIDFLNKFLK